MYICTGNFSHEKISVNHHGITMKRLLLLVVDFLGGLCLIVTPLSCGEGGGKDEAFDPGQVYLVSTETGAGYAVFEKKVSRSQWMGRFYVDGYDLFAEAKDITYTSNVFGEFLQDNNGKKHRITSISSYEQPVFQEEPETWTYKDSVYHVSVDQDVPYASALGYWTSLPSSDDSFLGIYLSQTLNKSKSMLPLTMDVYAPDDGKKALRPLLVLIHGGAFYNGDKASAGFPEWGRYFAARGYLVASVNYRMGFWANPISVERAGYRAVQDVNAAIRFLVHEKSEYHVDPDRVFVAGTSAGGITALNLAFMRESDIPASARQEGSIDAVNPNLHDRFSVRAVGNLWGAVRDLSMIGNENTAVISYHSSGDPVVPFGADHPFQGIFLNDVLFDTMYGSGEITPYARSLGRRVELHSYDMPGYHTLHLDGNRVNHIFYEIETGLRDFFSSVMLPHPVSIQHVQGSSFFSIDDTDVSEISWKVEGGVILESDHEKVKVLLFPGAMDHTVTVSGRYRSGLTFIDGYTI